MRKSLRVLDEMYGSFNHLVSTRREAFDSGYDDDVRDNTDALGGPMIGINDPQAANHGVELARQRDRRNITVSPGRGAAYYNGSRHRPQGHGGVFGLALRGFIDQNDDSPAEVNGARFDDWAVTEVERAGISQIRGCKGNEGCGLPFPLRPFGLRRRSVPTLRS